MNIGIILNDLLPSQINFLAIKYINGLSQKPGIDFSIFYQEITPHFMYAKCGVMNISEIAHAKDILIATTLDQAEYLTKLTNNTLKVFYIWDLEWIRNKKDFIRNIGIYQSDRIRLITRNEGYAKLVENYTNRRVDAVIDQFMLPEIINKAISWTN